MTKCYFTSWLWQSIDDKLASMWTDAHGGYPADMHMFDISWKYNKIQKFNN